MDAAKTFTLSAYAAVQPTSNFFTPVQSIRIGKKPYDKDFSAAHLAETEWKELFQAMPQLEMSTREMREATQRGETPEPILKRLSDRYAVQLNAFQAPNNVTYVTMAIRQYFTNEEGQVRFRKDDGVTLSYEETLTLASHMEAIQEHIGQLLASSTTIKIHGYDDVVKAKAFIDRYWKNGSTASAFLRLEKPH